MGLEEFEPIFGEPKLEWVNPKGPTPPCRFLFHVHSPDSSHFSIHVTDFRSNTWEAKRSVSQLEDMRDDIGIGGSWSEFIEYLTASIKSEDVKLVFESNSNSDVQFHHIPGIASAKLVAQKSKGMPRISFPLTKLVGSTASEALANLSLGLFKTFKSIQHLLIQEQERSCLLTKVISAEKVLKLESLLSSDGESVRIRAGLMVILIFFPKLPYTLEKNENIESQLEQPSKRQKLQNMNSSEKSDVSDPSMSNCLLNSPEKKAARDPVSSKVANRVIPAYRRAKVRGAVLLDTEDDKAN
ncbi:hypothetical protein JRO89_XS08G0086900 [Xanthoceras sorbifolium]|uniref:Uncharacterized protein n=1 Tax=Xanthoceras sorbifolium TaxID=99658 RepID=A0ABQ8HP34_9ROSI|nr:hypothetical protein JRO89_XS08G0086900 [Xanthoceras sorbifolium]